MQIQIWKSQEDIPIAQVVSDLPPSFLGRSRRRKTDFVGSLSYLRFEKTRWLLQENYHTSSVFKWKRNRLLPFKLLSMLGLSYCNWNHTVNKAAPATLEWGLSLHLMWFEGWEPTCHFFCFYLQFLGQCWVSNKAFCADCKWIFLCAFWKV